MLDGNTEHSTVDIQEAFENPLAVRRELSRRRLRHFTTNAWPILEPGTPYLPNWHIDAICHHLEAVSAGQIRHLLINIPPRSMKSLSVSVCWPVWTWIDNPQIRWLFSSYAQSLSTRDALKSRRLIQSAWFQQNFGDCFTLTADQNTKTRYDNTDTGYRIATSVDGAATGEGGDIIVVDDPHNVKEGESQVTREAALVWWDEVMSTRLNNPKTGAKVIVMQRVHESDLSGHVLEQGGYEHLMLPQEFEKDRKCFTCIGFEDPRTEDGELLWPERADDVVVESFKTELGEYGYAGQMQQRPSPRKGGMFKVERIAVLEELPKYPIKWWRSWDKAGTDDGGAYTVGALIGRYAVSNGDARKHYKYIIADVERGQWSAGTREQVIKDTARKDGRQVKVVIEQEPGSGGKESADATVRNLKGFRVEKVRPTGDKVDRADPFAVAVENGDVDMLVGEWNEPYVNELRLFPKGTFKDQVDSSAQGFNMFPTLSRIHVG